MTVRKVLLFGDINVDNILLLPENPVPGRDGFATKAETHLGGAACNTAAILSCLSQPSALIGAIGCDHWAMYVLNELRQAGIDSSRVIQKPDDQTGLIFIPVTENGERTMLSYRGVNTLITPSDIPTWALDDVVMLHLSGYLFLQSPQRDTAFELISRAREKNIPISMDTGLDPVILKSDEIKHVLPNLDVLITGWDEALLLTGQDKIATQLDTLLKLGIGHVAIKLGKDGAHFSWQDGKVYLPAFQVNVVDTTGAGDAFSAGLILGMLWKMSAPASLTLANAMGGLATHVMGSARISPSQLVEFLGIKQKQEPHHPAIPYFNEILKNISLNR